MFSLQKRFPFLSFRKSTVLDPEVAHTLVELIEIVRGELAGYTKEYYEASGKRDDAKRAVGYRAKVDEEELKLAWELLSKKSWISLQNISNQKPITTLAPLAGLHQLNSLIIIGNRIKDLSPLTGLTALRRLAADRNDIIDLAPIQNCHELRDVSLTENPIGDFSPLTSLPGLTELSLSVDQLPAFQKCIELFSLEQLSIRGDGLIPSLESFPQMPALRTLRLDNVRSLEGIERFPSLLNLHVVGCFDRLDAIVALRQLTHGNLHSSQALDVTPLSALYTLRKLSLHCPAVIGLSELSRLPALHDISCWEGAKNSPGLDALKKTLSTWDHEFLAPTRRHEPSVQLEIVTETEFDHYDQDAAYGLKPDECNPDMVSSERGWLLDRIRDTLSIDLEEKMDFDLPWRGGMRRSDTLIIYSLKAYHAFREIVRRVQIILGEAQNDWIIYFQSSLWEGADEPSDEVKDFIVWLYPQKIQATADQAGIVESLLV